MIYLECLRWRNTTRVGSRYYAPLDSFVDLQEHVPKLFEHLFHFWRLSFIEAGTHEHEARDEFGTLDGKVDRRSAAGEGLAHKCSALNSQSVHCVCQLVGVVLANRREQ